MARNIMKLASQNKAYKAAKAKERAASKAAGVAWRRAVKTAKSKSRKRKK